MTSNERNDLIELETIQGLIETRIIELVRKSALGKQIRGYILGEHMGVLPNHNMPALVIVFTGDTDTSEETGFIDHLYTGYIALDAAIPDRLVFNNDHVAEVDSYKLCIVSANIIEDEIYKDNLRDIELNTEYPYIIQLGQKEYGLQGPRENMMTNRLTIPFEIRTKKRRVCHDLH